MAIGAVKRAINYGNAWNTFNTSTHVANILEQMKQNYGFAAEEWVAYDEAARAALTIAAAPATAATMAAYLAHFRRAWKAYLKYGGDSIVNEFTAIKALAVARGLVGATMSEVFLAVWGIVVP